MTIVRVAPPSPVIQVADRPYPEKVERKFGMFFTKRMMNQNAQECNS
ncbi:MULTISPECIES: hypothetical protein [Wolbachia]|nr:hypothetical protein [Wolbachia endosymbiont of Drosophila simulans]